MKAFVTVTQQQFDISAEQGVPAGDILTQSVDFGNFIKGKDGSVIYNGSGVPANILGVNGDFYIDNVAPNNYYEKISGVWVLQGHLHGADGTNGTNGNDGADGVGIQSVLLFSTVGKQKTYRITFTDATTFDYDVTDGNDGIDGTDGIDGENGITPTIGLNGNWYIGATDTGVKASGTDGTNGLDGTDGVGISNIEKTGTVLNVDEYTITFSNASTFIFYVTNGLNGSDGIDGQNGTNGTDGRGIVSIIKTSTVGLVDTYTITYSDSTTSTFDVTNSTGTYDIYLAGGGTLSEVDFNASITNIPSHIADATKHIDTTTAEFSGAIDETNDKFTIWDNSLLKWIRFSFTSLKTYLNGIYHKFGGSSFGAKQIIGATDNQDFGIMTDNTERITVLKDGKVGIGTTNPINKLSVNGNANFTGNVGFGIASPGGRIHLASDVYNDLFIFERTNPEYLAKWEVSLANGRMNFGPYPHTTFTNRKVLIDTGGTMSLGLLQSTLTHSNPNYSLLVAGKVGIGTVAPNSALQVVGGIQCGDDTAAASADKVGTIRQRDVNNKTLLEFCKNVAGVYEWEKINDKLSLDQTTPQTIQGNVNINGNLNAVTTNVNQSTLPSVNASQDAAILQDGSAFTGTYYVMPTNNIAVKFVASAAHTMGDFTVRVKSSATLTSTTATLRGYLYSDNAGSPSTLLATGNSIYHGSITTSYQELSLGAQYNLVAGNTYWLVIRWSSAPTGGNIIFDSNSDTNGGATSADAVSWTLTNVRLRYRLRGRTFYGINAFSTNSYGVVGISTNSFGVYGTSTNYFGIYGVSTNSVGVYGVSTTYIGVYGVSTNSFGVYGTSTNSFGVFGTSTNSYGVYGRSTNNRAGYFSRNTETPSAVPVVEIIQDHASDTNSVLDVKQDGTGEIARFYDSGVEVASIEKGGLGIYKKGVQIGDNTDVASSANVGATRYRTTANASYCEMCMKTGATTYAWVVIVTNTW